VAISSKERRRTIWPALSAKSGNCGVAACPERRFFSLQPLFRDVKSDQLRSSSHSVVASWSLNIAAGEAARAVVEQGREADLRKRIAPIAGGQWDGETVRSREWYRTGVWNMARASSGEVGWHLRQLFRVGSGVGLTDGQHLERIASADRQDERDAAEAAFETILARHGTMVLSVCRQVLRDVHAAEDAFQATFLVLARKASAIARREQLASWLYGVARHTALDARARAIRQQSKEKRLGSMLPVERPDQTETSELRAILDEELARLPERYRAAIVLCELEGLTRRQAAIRLGVSEGTLSSRLARAKEQLRGRLTRRGLALSAAALASALSREAHAVIVSPALVDSTIRVATLAAAGSSLAGVVSSSVATLTEGVLKAMLFAKLKLVVVGVVTVALITTGVGVVAQQPASTPHADQDRLKAVEQKLDRLLEVLGGSSRTVSYYPATVLPPPGGTNSAMPSAGHSISHGAVAQPAINPPNPAATATTSTVSGYIVGPAGGSAFVPTQPGQSASLDGRVASLEQRLGDLERRFGEMERRLNGLNRRPGQSSLPSGASSSSRSRGGGGSSSSGSVDNLGPRTSNPSALPTAKPAAPATDTANPPSADNAPSSAPTAGGSNTALLPPVSESNFLPTSTSAAAAPDNVPPPASESPR
jgi:RNA polymerase sigma factor (sigma-70 family)